MAAPRLPHPSFRPSGRRSMIWIMMITGHSRQEIVEHLGVSRAEIREVLWIGTNRHAREAKRYNQMRYMARTPAWEISIGRRR
jgi:hypothetical protein